MSVYIMYAVASVLRILIFNSTTLPTQQQTYKKNKSINAETLNQLLLPLNILEWGSKFDEVVDSVGGRYGHHTQHLTAGDVLVQ